VKVNKKQILKERRDSSHARKEEINNSGVCVRGRT